MSRFDEISVGDVVVGEVSGVVPFGTFVRFAEDADGLLHGETGLDVGARVSVRVVELDVERKRASLALA
jgi:predicted RNA-binding protein with RPS1 domain